MFQGINGKILENALGQTVILNHNKSGDYKMKKYLIYILFLIITSPNVYAEKLYQKNELKNYSISGKLGVHDASLYNEEGNAGSSLPLYILKNTKNIKQDLKNLAEGFDIDPKEGEFIKDKGMIGFKTDTSFIVVNKNSGMFVYRDYSVEKYTGGKPISDAEAVKKATVTFTEKLKLNLNEIASSHVNHMASSSEDIYGNISEEIIDNTVVFFNRQINGIPVFGSELRVYFNNKGQMYSAKGLWRNLSKQNENSILRYTKVLKSQDAADKIQNDLSENGELDGVDFNANLVYLELPGKVEQTYLTPAYFVKYNNGQNYAFDFVDASNGIERLSKIRELASLSNETVQSDVKENNKIHLNKRFDKNKVIKNTKPNQFKRIKIK